MTRRRRRQNRTTLVLIAIVASLVGIFWVLSIMETNATEKEKCTKAGGVWSADAKICFRTSTVIDLERLP